MIRKQRAEIAYGNRWELLLHQNKPCGADCYFVCAAFVIFCLCRFNSAFVAALRICAIPFDLKTSGKKPAFCLGLLQRCRCEAVDQRYETCRGRRGVMNRAKKQTFARLFLCKTQNLMRFVQSKKKGLTNGKESDRIDA